MEQMREEGVAPTLTTYTVLIDGHARMQRFDKAHKLLNEMEQHGLKPNAVTYNAILNGYCRSLRIQEAKQLFTWMDEVGGLLEPNVITYSTLIYALAKSGDFVEVNKLMSRMKEKKIRPTTVTFNGLINASVKHGDLVSAERWFAEMQELGCTPTAYTFLPLLGAHANAKEFDKVEAYCKLMEELSVPLNEEITVTLARAFVRNGSNEHLQRLLAQAPSLFLHNAVIDALVKENRMAEAEQQVQRLLEDGFTPNNYTYFPIFAGYTLQRNTNSAARVFVLMENTPSCNVDELMYVRLAGNFVHEGNYAQARDVLARMVKRFPASKPAKASALYDSIVQGYAARGEAAEAQAVVDDMQQQGFKPGHQTLINIAAAWQQAAQPEKFAKAQQELIKRGINLNEAQLASVKTAWITTSK